MLRELVLRAGHAIVEPPDADVALFDGAEGTAFDGPIVILGPHDHDAAGWLPADASAEQIDAALRAVTVGLAVRVAGEFRLRGFEDCASDRPMYC